MNLIELKFNFCRFPILASVKSSRFNDLTFHCLNASLLSVQPSQAQSSPVKPSQTKSSHPSPPGKETGKEMACPPKPLPDYFAFDDGGWRNRVKFLAIFDHLDGARPSITRSPKYLIRSRITQHAIRNT